MRNHVIGLLAVLVLPGAAAAQAGDPVGRLRAYHYGADRTLPEDLGRWVVEIRGDASRRAAGAGALGEVLAAEATFDAKELACRYLALIGSAAQVPALSALLPDPELGHYALLALARIPGREAEDAMLAGLSKSPPRTQLEILDAMAERGDRRMVPAAASLVDAEDPSTAGGAAWALAKMATPAAHEALRTAFTRSTGDQKVSVGHALLECAKRSRAAGDEKEAVATYTLVGELSGSPVLKAAALRGIVLGKGVQSMPMVLRALNDDGSLEQSEAAALARDIPGSDAVRQLSAALPRLTARGRVVLLQALSDRGDHAATAGVMALAHSTDPATRAAAIRALAALGDASSVPLLLQTASAGPAGERAAARTALARLRGASVDSKLMAAMDSGEPAARVEAIQSLGERQYAPAVPRMLQTASTGPAPARAAALRVLRDVGQPELLKPLISLMLTTKPGDRDSEIEAVTEIARRGADEAQRTAPLLDSLASVTRPADRSDLLSALAQVGGPRALEAIRRSETDASPEVRRTAIRLLADWGSDEPMADLLGVVKSSHDAGERAIALRGYVRMIGVSDQRSPDQALALYKEAGGLSKGPDDIRLILSGLAKVGSLAALEYASTFLKDLAVRPEAEAAVVGIARGTVGAWREQTRAALEPIATGSSNEESRKRAAETLALIGRFGDYVTAWEVSPAYQQQGADYAKLFDIPFPPEEAGRDSAVPWRIMPAGTSAEQPWLLDLLALWGGEQRVAYLRTSVWSESARDLVLELGSDDGLKVWWNGEVALAHNTARAVAPGQEHVKVKAQAGWNRLLLKVTQNTMGWGAVLRVTNPEGTPATGLRFAIPSDPGVAAGRAP